MNKADLQNWVHESYQKWESFLDQFDTALMHKPGVAGNWSMKDVIAHLTGWNRQVIVRFQAALQGEPEPPPPWPATLDSDDEINAWFYERNHQRPLEEVLAETRAQFQQLFSALEALPDDARIETVRLDDGREFYLPWVGDKRYPICEFFDHFRDDHEQEIRAWLEQQKQQ